MKRYIWLILLLSACNTKTVNIFTEENLVTQSFNINTKADKAIDMEMERIRKVVNMCIV